MILGNPVTQHREATRQLAKSLNPNDVYSWLVEHGYFPESYVLPPCFQVVKRPRRQKLYTQLKNRGTKFNVPTKQIVGVHFPKSEFTDRNFGIMHPEHHNDISLHIARNWKSIVNALVPSDSDVASYSFPIPIDSKQPGRMGHLRSGRMIYEFIGMIDKDIASIAYRYQYLVRADIKNFYPSIYTHSIAWAIHGKAYSRKRTRNYKLLGNRLDRLFQRANDGCTNGVPIGPVVSDIIAEIVASAVDKLLTKALRDACIDCQAIRFKDDYRILTRTEDDGRRVIKALQNALKEYNLEINEGKTAIMLLPEGLFREWVSKYHQVHPKKRRRYTWKEFRELYLAVLRIDKECPGTGVIDRFLADIVSKRGNLKLTVGAFNLQKVISMLLMLATRRTKAFPKILAIIETILRSPFGMFHENAIVCYLEKHLMSLSVDEERNKYLICWISYFIVSNKLKDRLGTAFDFKDPVARSVYNNRPLLFKDAKEYKIFRGCVDAGKEVSMLQHLDVFNPLNEALD